MKIALLALLTLTGCVEPIPKTPTERALQAYDICMSQAREHHQIIGSATTWTRLDTEKSALCVDYFERQLGALNAN